jgi:hypothetical protein
MTKHVGWILIVRFLFRVENDAMKGCKGKQCEEWDDINHSKECIEEHDRAYSCETTVPSCFDRAEYQGRVFDNCRHFQVCEQCEPICVDNPLSKKET